MTELQLRPAHEAEINEWDAWVARNPAGGDFVQARAFALTKAAVGWTPRYFVFERAGQVESVSLVLERKIPFLGKYWYLPRGPVVSEATSVHEHVTALRDYARNHESQLFCVTVEPPLVRDEHEHEVISLLANVGAQHRPGLQGNTNTAIVQLQDSDDAMLASFQKRCRNSINRAVRDGVEVREYPADSDTFAHMHRLMTLVGGGGQVLRLRSRDYAERFWRSFSETSLGRFYGIEVDGTPALLAFVIRVGERAYYKDGGSERPRTSSGMSNLLQWHMMRQMRDEGATSYDLMGTPPRDRLKDPESPNFSLASFKLSFAGDVTEFIGGFDLPLRPRAYRLWQRFGLPITQRMHRRRYRDLDLY